MGEIELQRQIQELQERMRWFESGAYATNQWTILQEPLTSTSWDGDSYSSGSETMLDLSAVFGAPNGIRAVLLFVRISDSDSATSGTDARIAFGANTGGASDPAIVSCDGTPNDDYVRQQVIVPCNSDGDIYYHIYASGASTCDVVLRIVGYML